MKELMLTQLTPGQSLRVTRMECGKELRRSLLSHGLTGGTYVRCLRLGPRGSSALYEIRGSMLALRSSDGKRIFGELIP